MVPTGGWLLAEVVILVVVISGAAVPDPALKGSDRTAKDTDEAEETNVEEANTSNEIDDEYETDDENQDKELTDEHDAAEVDDQEEPSVDEDMEDEKETADELFLGATVSAEEMERIYATNCASCHAMDSMPPLDYVDKDEREVLADWLAGFK